MNQSINDKKDRSNGGEDIINDVTKADVLEVTVAPIAAPIHFTEPIEQDR